MTRGGVRLAALLLASAWSSSATAQVRAITDITAGIATRDGTIGATEYAGSTTGVNTGFGGKLGAGTRLHFDSDTTGNLALAIQDTTSGGTESNNWALKGLFSPGQGGGLVTSAIEHKSVLRTADALARAHPARPPTLRIDDSASRANKSVQVPAW